MRKASPAIATKFMQFFVLMIFILAINIIVIVGRIPVNEEKNMK